MIKEVKKYTDDDGKSVTAYIPISVAPTEDMIAYEGQVGIQTPMGIAPIRFPFPEDYTLEKCFEKFEDIANIEVDRIMKEAEEKAKNENLIVTPGQAMKQNIQFPK